MIQKYTIKEQWEILNKKLPLISHDNTFTNKTFNVHDINKYYGLFYLRTGFFCKSKCIHCFMEGKRIFNDLTLDELKSIVDVIPQNRIIILTGGEPTDRNDLIEILKYLKEKKFVVNLETNGIKFFDKNYLNNIIPYIDLAFIPIHSTDPDIFDKTTRIPGSFEKTWTGLKNLMETEIYHMTISVFNQLNYKSMEKTFDDIQKEFPGQLMSLTFPHPVGAANTKEVVPRYSDVKETVQNILKKHAKYTIVHYLPKCLTYPYHNDVVDIGLTDRIAMDYIDNKWDIITYVNKEESKVKGPNCDKCIFYKECAGVWSEYAKLYPDLEKDLIPITTQYSVNELKIRFPNLDSNMINEVLIKNKNIPKEEILSDLDSFTLRVQYSCDNACVHCFVENKKNVKKLDLNEIQQIIDNIDKSIKAITITGGEPTLRSDFKQILQYIKEKDFLINLQTNGKRFSDLNYLKDLEQYIDSVIIPIHSSDSEIFDKITKKEGSVEKTFLAFKNLTQSKKIYVQAQIVINKLNYKTLLQTCDFIQNISPGNTMLLTFSVPDGAAFSKDVTPKLSEIKSFLHETLKKYGYLIQTQYIPKCYLYPYQTIVKNIDDPNVGKKYKPGMDYTGLDWELVDYNNANSSMRVKSEKCKYCKFNNECYGILKLYENLYKELDVNPIYE